VFENFDKEIERFKNTIEIRTERDYLEEIFLDIEEHMTSEHQITTKGLKGKQFYTDVDRFKLALKKVFHEIEKREQYPNIEVIAKNETGEYVDIFITHIDSFASISCKELLKEAEDGDFADIKNLLQNLCDWSVQNYYEQKSCEVNYLTSDKHTKDISVIDSKPKGFTHRLRFYR
jgi:hypothetical protein